MKYILLVLSVIAIDGCTTVGVKTPLQSLDNEIADKLIKKQNPKIVSFEHCAKAILIFPLAPALSEEEIFQKLVGQTGANAIANFQYSSKLMFTLFYNQVCTTFSGYPVKM